MKTISLLARFMSQNHNANADFVGCLLLVNDKIAAVCKSESIAKLLATVLNRIKTADMESVLRDTYVVISLGKKRELLV